MALEKIKQILCEEFGIDEDKISPETSFVTDLGLDSIDFADFTMSVEDEFGIEFPEEIMTEYFGDESDEELDISETPLADYTVGELIKYIEEIKG